MNTTITQQIIINTCLMPLTVGLNTLGAKCAGVKAKTGAAFGVLQSLNSFPISIMMRSYMDHYFQTQSWWKLALATVTSYVAHVFLAFKTVNLYGHQLSVKKTIQMQLAQFGMGIGLGIVGTISAAVFIKFNPDYEWEKALNELVTPSIDDEPLPLLVNRTPVNSTPTHLNFIKV